MGNRKIELVYAEDNPDIIEFVQRALSKNSEQVYWEIFKDGQLLLDYLTGKGAYQFAPVYLPKLILLDLRLPKMSGFEVLEQIRMNPTLRYIPVVILSSAHTYADTSRAYELGANGFVKKAEGFRKLSEDVTNIVNYWLYSNIY